MKNNHIKKTLIGIQTGIVLFLTLTSCKNFLNAGKVSDEIKDSIAYNNAKTVNIVISCKEDMGTIYPQQSYNAKLGYDFEIQFIINSDNYVIKDPAAVFEAVSKYDNTVSRADCVEFTPVERTIEDIKLGLYKAKAKIIKDNSDILIRPVCTTLPTVVEIYPPYVPSGYAQDTTVKITFSKPMDPESFGNFECLIMTSDNGSVKNFYDNPYFSNDNCVLNIPTKKGENILNPDTSGTKQITININVNELKDTEGLTLSNSIIYTYCLNQTTDRKEPVIYSYELKTPENKILNSTDFNTWEQTPSIFSQNHLKDTVIFSIDGYDDESGLSGLRITETFFRLINGNSSAHAISQYSEYEQITFTSESSGHTVYNVSDTYTLKTPNDGIIKLDFQVIDKSGNFSLPQTYYVIKDTTIDSNLITISGFNELEYHEAAYDSDTFSLSLNDIPKDTYYENYSSDFLITVKWGYKEDEIKNIAEQDGLTFSFNYNPNLLTYIQIICSDELGNQRIITRVQPPRPNYNRKCITVASTSKTFTFTPYSYKSLQEIAAYNEAQLLVYFVERNVSAKPYKETVFKYDNKYVSVFRKGNSNGRYYYYPFYVLKYSDNSYWASPLSNYFMNIDGLEGYIKECIVNPVDSENTTTAIEDNNLLPEVLKIQAEPATNTGCYKIQLDKSQLDNNFTWNFNFTNTSTKEVESFNLDLFYLSTPAEYTLSVEARNSEGETYIKKSQLMQVNNEEASEKIILNKDTTPPVFNFIKEEKYFIDTSGVFLTTLPKDNNGGIGIYTDPQNSSYGEISYYFIPNTGIHVSDYNNYTIQELEAYKDFEKTVKYDKTKYKIFIPFDNLNEDFYTLCVVAKDQENNSIVQCIPVLYKFLYKSVTTKVSSSVSSTNNSRKYKISTTFETTEEAQRTRQTIIKYEDNEWSLVEITNLNSTVSGTTLNTDFDLGLNTSSFGTYGKFIIGPDYKNKNILVSDSGFYNVYYKHVTSSVSKITEKSMWPCVNGYQIKTKSGTNTFIHTLYSDKKLTEGNSTNDAIIWIHKGKETGIVTTTQDILYNQSNWDNIPVGSYYTILVHYADGDILMTEVKQKQY